MWQAVAEGFRRDVRPRGLPLQGTIRVCSYPGGWSAASAAAENTKSSGAATTEAAKQLTA